MHATRLTAMYSIIMYNLHLESITFSVINKSTYRKSFKLIELTIHFNFNLKNNK